MKRTNTITSKSNYKLYNAESRFKLALLWREYIGKEFMIYNIDNKHQCFNENPPKIIQYFEGIDYFYGCIICGKYHFCYSNYHTCYSITNKKYDPPVEEDKDKKKKKKKEEEEEEYTIVD